MSETITATMSRWAADLCYDQIGEAAVREARRYLLDSLGCAFGGYQQEDAEIALGVLDEIAGVGNATVLGSGKKMDPVSASLANALMVRVMDYNDIYWQQDPSHPSDIIPAALALGERNGGTDRMHDRNECGREARPRPRGRVHDHLQGAIRGCPE